MQNRIRALERRMSLREAVGPLFEARDGGGPAWQLPLGGEGVFPTLDPASSYSGEDRRHVRCYGVYKRKLRLPGEVEGPMGEVVGPPSRLKGKTAGSRSTPPLELTGGGLLQYLVFM